MKVILQTLATIASQDQIRDEVNYMVPVVPENISLLLHFDDMNLYQRWMNLSFKSRMYISSSTFAVALVSDYVLGRLETEAQARKKIDAELEAKSSQI